MLTIKMHELLNMHFDLGQAITLKGKFSEKTSYAYFNYEDESGAYHSATLTMGTQVRGNK